MTNETVTLQNLGGGAAAEQFNHELNRVLENILDPNTRATAPREITLKVKIKPDDDRELADLEIHCASKLAAVKPYPTQIYIGVQRGGEVVATEYNPKQLHLNDTPTGQADGENIVRFETKKGN